MRDGERPQPDGEGREIWREARYRVVVRPVPTRSGAVVERAFVDHPGAVVIIARDAAGRIAWVRNRRPALAGAVVEELPAGTMRRGEDPGEAAQRELAEEAGVTAARWRQLGALWLAPGCSNERLIAFVAEDLGACAATLDDDEDLDAVWHDAAAMAEGIAAGTICDAKSLAALYLLERIGD